MLRRRIDSSLLGCGDTMSVPPGRPRDADDGGVFTASERHWLCPLLHIIGRLSGCLE
jgi:hypothetical protein